MRYTFFMIKPDGMPSAFRILEHLNRHLQTSSWNSETAPPFMIEACRTTLTVGQVVFLYNHAIDKIGDRWDAMIAYLTSAPVLVTCWQGDNVVEHVRKALGPTMCLDAPQSTIRGFFGTLPDGRLLRPLHENVAHASDNPAGARRELREFFPELGYT